MKKSFMMCSAAMLLMAAVAPAMSASEIEFEYTVPTGVNFVCGTNPGTTIYHRPNAKAPYLKMVDMGEGSYYLWSNEKPEYDAPVTKTLFADWWLTVAQGTSGAYTKVFMPTEKENDFGYVLTSKTRAVKPLPLTINNLGEGYSVIKSGTFAGFVVRVFMGEGVSCDIGRIEDNMLVLFKSMNIYYDENVKGVKLDDVGNLCYGPDCGTESTLDYTGSPSFDASKLSPSEQTKFFGLFSEHGFNSTHILIKTPTGLNDVITGPLTGRQVTLRYPGK